MGGTEVGLTALGVALIAVLCSAYRSRSATSWALIISATRLCSSRTSCIISGVAASSGCPSCGCALRFARTVPEETERSPNPSIRRILIRTPRHFIGTLSTVLAFTAEELKKDPNFRPPDSLLELLARPSRSVISLASSRGGTNPRHSTPPRRCRTRRSDNPACCSTFLAIERALPQPREAVLTERCRIAEVPWPFGSEDPQ